MEVVTFEALDDDGRGVGRLPTGETVHVAGVLPGETARVRVEHVSPHAPRAWGSLVELVGAPSTERVPPACPGHGRCGGCILQHLAYPAQLTEKRARVERAFAEHPALREVEISDVVASPRELHYRNKAKYVVAPGAGGGLVFGSYAPASHDLVPMAGCQVPEEPLDGVARAAMRLADEERIPGYDERERTGELRGLIVRANVDGDVLVVLVTKTRLPVPALKRVAKVLRAERPEVKGVVCNINPTTGGAIFGPEDVLLDGASALQDTVGEIPLELSARAFFQVNRAQAARLYDSAARAAAGKRVVDLYTGVGGIALTVAKRGARVVGIEVHAGAVRDATATARKLGLAQRVSFEVGDAAAALPAAARFLGGVDAVVVNPPRKGLAPAARTAIVELAPSRLVYVSCNPTTLAADLATFVARGYGVGQVVPFDLMPGTPHIETLAVLSR